MAGETILTVVGNLAKDPELRFTAAGRAKATFSVASTPRYLDKATNQWKDGETLWTNVVCWGDLAENAVESLQKGTRVIVQGRFGQRSYEDGNGNKRNIYELTADDLGPSLTRASAKVTKTSRQGGQQPARPAPPDPWTTTPGGGGSLEEPPF